MYRHNIFFSYNKVEAENLFQKFFDELQIFYNYEVSDFENMFIYQNDKVSNRFNMEKYFCEATNLDYYDEENLSVAIEFICSFVAHKCCCKPAVITFDDSEDGAAIIIYDLEMANDSNKTIYNGNPNVITDRITILEKIKELKNELQFIIFEKKKDKRIDFAEVVNKIALAKKKVFLLIRAVNNYKLIIDSTNIYIRKGEE